MLKLASKSTEKEYFELKTNTLRFKKVFFPKKTMIQFSSSTLTLCSITILLFILSLCSFESENEFDSELSEVGIILLTSNY